MGEETATYRGFHSTFAALIIIKEFCLGLGSLCLLLDARQVLGVKLSH